MGKKMVTVLLILSLLLSSCGIETDVTNSPSLPPLSESEVPYEEETSPSNIQDQKTDRSALKITDNLYSYNKTVLENIARNYFMVFGFDKCFTEDYLHDYGEVINFFTYGGVYRLLSFNPWERPDTYKYYDASSGKFLLPAEVVSRLIEDQKIDHTELSNLSPIDGIYVFDSFYWYVKPELHQYFNEDTWTLTLPASAVDDYILGKFNTAVDRAKLPEGISYDMASDTYTIQAFTGDFYYRLEVDDKIRCDGPVTQFICTATHDEVVQPESGPSYRFAFTISFDDGEYRYLSIEILDNANVSEADTITAIYLLARKIRICDRHALMTMFYTAK